ncbi:hypothetical protein [Limnoglobus roseus]|uniref:Protein BatD n=1 Tax=Limnoglobus roseus TaxID=2598579 RepID=A0A5C1A652_9BACT|nr:hypothetical protein [Limnoglobus roseus]QEL14621.1 hypothetical protein PX52LOC_01512 [Limnoglobus roseus]
MNPTAAVTLDRDSLGLADTLTATLRVEGQAPLVVTLSKEILQSESAAVWGVKPLGAAVVSPLADGRSAWTLKLRLDPFVPGEAVPLAFAPLTVKAGTNPETSVDVPAKSVKVQTAIRDPKASDARGPTGYLDPPPGSPPPSGVPPYLAFLVGSVVILIAAVVVRLRRRPAAVTPPTPAVRLETLAGRWAANAVGGREFAEELAAIVRTHLESRFAVPATRRATGELGDAAPLDRFKGVLDWCDGVKFGGREPAAEECGDVMNRTRELLAIQAGTSSSSFS